MDIDALDQIDFKDPLRKGELLCPSLIHKERARNPYKMIYVNINK
jgi:hypothetical protein